MFCVIKKLTIAKFLCIVLGLGLVFGIYFSNKALVSAKPSQTFCVVLDAGHGGIDGGSQGKVTGVFERDINLSISKKVESLLKTLNIEVVQTRTTEDGLYGAFASGFKMRDMKARKAIIEEANPDLVVSIHLNSFTSSTSKGAQVYYKPNSEISKELAEKMQNLFAKNLENSRTECFEGDFYILTCTKKPGILVECGFLSNPEEEQLLITDDYQQKVAYQIFCGIVSYFDLVDF